MTATARVVSLPPSTGLSALETRYTPGHVLGSHLHPLASVSLVFAGGQEERVGTRRHDCTSHSVVFKTAQVEHSDHVGRAGMHGLFVELSPRVLETFRDAVGTPPDVSRHRSPAAHALVSRIAVELRAQQAGHELAVEGLIYQLLATIARRGADSGAPTRRCLWIEKAREFVEAHFRESPSLSVIADAIGVHPSHLATVYHAAFGRTVGEHVRELRVEYARAALSDRARSLSEIAHAAGFSDQSHLTRLFRRQLGVTPGEYRRLTGVERAGEAPPRPRT